VDPKGREQERSTRKAHRKSHAQHTQIEAELIF